MSSYIPGLEGVPTSFPEILAGMIADYQARVPGWTPNPGAPEVVLMETFALRHAVKLDVDAQVRATIFTYFGNTIGGVPFKAATPALAVATLHVAAPYVAEEHLLPAGFRVAIEGPEEPATFQTAADVVIAAGEATAAVALVAAEPGAAGNEFDGDIVPIDTRAWLGSITLNAATAGGEDAEDEDTYRDRLAAKERRDSPTIITAVDAQEALLELPGVGRCLILDNYVPATEGKGAEEGVAGAFTAVLTDENGANVSAETKAQALALINSERLLDLVGHVIDPTRTAVTVAYGFDVLPGWEPAAVKAAADQAIATYLSDATWGLLAGAGGARDWQDELKVRYSEIYGVLNTVQGLNHALKVEINGVKDKDLTLAGPGALPTITSITGTLE